MLLALLILESLSFKLIWCLIVTFVTFVVDFPVMYFCTWNTGEESHIKLIIHRMIVPTKNTPQFTTTVLSFILVAQ